MLHPPRRPADLDLIHAIGLPQAEMKPRVRRRLIAPAADRQAVLPPPARRDDDPGADGVAVRRRPLEAERQRSGRPAVRLWK